MQKNMWVFRLDMIFGSFIYAFHLLSVANLLSVLLILADHDDC